MRLDDESFERTALMCVYPKLSLGYLSKNRWGSLDLKICYLKLGAIRKWEEVRFN